MYINIIILIIIAFIVGLISGINLNKLYKKETLINTTETLINTDDTPKKYLSTCCETNKCYDKPPHLQKDKCEANKEDAFKELDTQFTPIYTKEEYEKKINEYNNQPNSVKETNYNNKTSEKIVVDNLDDNTYNKIINDNNMINGISNNIEYAPYNVNK